MPPPSDRRLAVLGLGVTLLLMAVFATLVFQYGRDLRGEIRAKMIERDAAVLYPVAQQQIDHTAASNPAGLAPQTSLAALLPDARREGLLAMAIFDEAGVTLQQVPSNQLLVELPADDFIRLQNGKPLTRFFPEFSLAQLFPGTPGGSPTPVLEIILPLRRSHDLSSSAPDDLIGFVRYHLDARALDRELATLDRSVDRKTTVTLLLGLASISVIVAAASFALRRAQRLLAERNAQLVRTNFELTLAAKASALGQITSHLLHGLQGPVAGLRAMVANRGPDAPGDWHTAADYTERMQALIHEAVALLGDHDAGASYELTDHELADIVRRRNTPAAEKKGVTLNVTGGLARGLDSHRGGVLCLIVSNLVDNAVHATDPGRTITVLFRTIDANATILVSDEGGGISDEALAHLFEPGHSAREGGSGLGLAISQLLARQIGATLSLASTGPKGTSFNLTLPLGT